MLRITLRPTTLATRPTLRRGVLAAVVAVVAVTGVYLVTSSRAAGLVGDVNGDGSVGVTDLSLLLGRWGTSNAAADLNGDGTVGLIDLSMLLAHWGQTAPTPSPSPTPTPSGAVKAIDSANTITDPNWFVQAYAAGIRLYVMQATNWNDCGAWSRTQPQLKMALDAGLKIAIYTRNPTCWQGGIDAAGPYKAQLQFFAIDVETDPGIPVTQAMVDGVRAAGVRPIVYSGSGMWSQVMGGNVTSFSSLPLWDTNAGTINFNSWTPDVLSPAPQQYGGWNTATTMRVGVQQMFEYNLNGVAVDLNSFNASFLQ